MYLHLRIDLSKQFFQYFLVSWVPVLYIHTYVCIYTYTISTYMYMYTCLYMHVQTHCIHILYINNTGPQLTEKYPFFLSFCLTEEPKSQPPRSSHFVCYHCCSIRILSSSTYVQFPGNWCIAPGLQPGKSAYPRLCGFQTFLQDNFWFKSQSNHTIGL